MYLKIDRRIGYENQKKGTSNRIWQANAFIGTKIALYISHCSFALLDSLISNSVCSMHNRSLQV